jgi:REP-associated tyrosine transposase
MSKFPRTPQRLELLYIRDPLYFITCCTYRRRPTLASSSVHNAFLCFADRAQSQFGIAVGRYVILPDHLHLFVSVGEDIALAKWVGTLKRFLSKAVDNADSADPLWQRGFFDHVMRSAESYSQKWDYVRENPVRASLVKDADDWPYSGEFVRLAFA